MQQQTYICISFNSFSSYNFLFFYLVCLAFLSVMQKSLYFMHHLFNYTFVLFISKFPFLSFAIFMTVYIAKIHHSLSFFLWNENSIWGWEGFVFVFFLFLIFLKIFILFIFWSSRPFGVGVFNLFIFRIFRLLNWYLYMYYLSIWFS